MLSSVLRIIAANLADPDGSVCDEDPPQAIAVFSRQRGTCDDYCYEAEPVGEWVCRGECVARVFRCSPNRKQPNF